MAEKEVLLSKHILIGHVQTIVYTYINYVVIKSFPKYYVSKFKYTETSKSETSVVLRFEVYIAYW